MNKCVKMTLQQQTGNMGNRVQQYMAEKVIKLKASGLLFRKILNNASETFKKD